MDFIALK